MNSSATAAAAAIVQGETATVVAVKAVVEPNEIDAAGCGGKRKNNRNT